MRHPIATLFVLCPALLAQDPPRTGTAPTPAQNGAKGEFGLDFTTQYFFRGLQQENQGLIAQPRVRLGFDVHEASEGLRDLDLSFGLWNSLHDGPTGGADGPWFESAFDIDLAAQLEERLHLGAAYVAYTSPNDSFDNVQELQFRARLDDRAMWFESIESGLQPTMTIAFETNGQRDFGDDRGIYLQVGVAPFFGIGNLGEAPLTLTVPVAAGFSLGDYFEEVGGGNDEFFGFFDVGAELSCPLQFLPARMGPWNAMAALHFLVLGDNAEERNQGDASELIFSFGVSTTF